MIPEEYTVISIGAVGFAAVAMAIFIFVCQIKKRRAR